MILGNWKEKSNIKKIIIFNNFTDIIFQILSGKKILPMRIFLNSEIESLIDENFEKWVIKK